MDWQHIWNSLVENRFFIYATGTAGVVLVFFARRFAGRLSDDVYDFLKHRLLGRPREKKHAPAPPPSDKTRDETQNQKEDANTVRTRKGLYRLRAVLAHGELSTLYESVRLDPEPGMDVVVKIAGNPQDNDLLQCEARTLGILHGQESRYRKHLPEVLDQFRTEDNRQGVILERLQGHDLYSVREKYKDGVPARHVLWIFRRSLSILGYAHSLGIIHGNVDPAHLIIRAHDHNVYLIDWSYAAYKPGQTGQGFKAHNETYSPPEVLERKPPVPPSDLYALGKTMIFLLGGNPKTDEMPDSVDERFQRFVRFFVLPGAMSRARDAWEMYQKLDELREELYGPHEFIEFKM